MKVRDDLSEVHRLAWDHVARPGSWWTTALRVEFAHTVIGATGTAMPQERTRAASATTESFGVATVTSRG